MALIPPLDPAFSIEGETLAPYNLTALDEIWGDFEDLWAWGGRCLVSEDERWLALEAAIQQALNEREISDIFGCEGQDPPSPSCRAERALKLFRLHLAIECDDYRKTLGLGSGVAGVVGIATYAFARTRPKSFAARGGLALTLAAALGIVWAGVGTRL